MGRLTGRNLFLKRKLPSPVKTPRERSSDSARSASGSAFSESPNRTPRLAPKLNRERPSATSSPMIRTIVNSRAPLGAVPE